MREFPGHNGTIYVMVVSTGSYAGNFSRNLCAYSTGQVGDCGVGDRESAEFVDEEGKDIWRRINEIIISLADDHGCLRPTSMRLTPKDAANYVYSTYTYAEKEYESPCHNDAEIFFREVPSADILKVITRRIKEFCDMKKIPLYHITFINETVTISEQLMDDIDWGDDK